MSTASQSASSSGMLLTSIGILYVYKNQFVTVFKGGPRCSERMNFSPV
jgi:hypothetical protein